MHPAVPNQSHDSIGDDYAGHGEELGCASRPDGPPGRARSSKCRPLGDAAIDDHLAAPFYAAVAAHAIGTESNCSEIPRRRPRSSPIGLVSLRARSGTRRQGDRQAGIPKVDRFPLAAPSRSRCATVPTARSPGVSGVGCFVAARPQEGWCHEPAFQAPRQTQQPPATRRGSPPARS
jgi:hypothetical protein